MNCRVSFKEWLRSNEFTNKERTTVVFLTRKFFF